MSLPRLVLIVIAMALAYLGATFVVANYNAARDRPPSNTCPMIRRTLAGAIDTYNLEKNVRLIDVPEEGAQAKLSVVPAGVIDKLKSSGYFQLSPCCPEIGPSGDSFAFTSWGPGLFCFAHGDFDAGASLHKAAREQLRLRGVSEPRVLAQAWETPAPGYEGGLTQRQSSFAVTLCVIVIGGIAFGMLRD